MDAEAAIRILEQLTQTEVTKTVHRDVYPAISPSRPELSQAGQIVLVPGGGSGVGLSISRSFVRASASTLIIIGRRADVLASSKLLLEEEAKSAGTGTKIVTRVCDVVDLTQVEEFWKWLKAEGLAVDVFVNNVAKFTEPKPLLELGTEEVWSQMEVNAHSPLYFTEKFYKQGGDKQKFLVNVTSGVIHTTHIPVVADRPAYVLSKMAAATMFQLIALHTPAEKLQIVTFNPGSVYGSGWKAMGFPKDKFDSDELCGAYAVWAASKEAGFLHGRSTWASWDVDELATGAVRKKIDTNSEFLKASIVGANGSYKD